MNLLQFFKNFKNDESGAVTVDWVVLTAGIVGLGLIVMTTVSGSLSTAATNIAKDVSAKQVAGTALNPTP